jgi:hypothetical protein
MALYTFHNLTLEVRQEREETGKGLAALLHELSWVSTPALGRAVSLRLSVSCPDGGLRAPPLVHAVFRADGFCGLEDKNDFYLTDGSSLFHLQAVQGQGYAYLAPSFFAKPRFLQRNFWAFGLLKLLRPLGFYSLHAAGVVTPQGLGLLIVGGSGSGKSTLAIGLIRQGWGYLSDDAVLLWLQPEGVEALAFRKNFYVNAGAAGEYTDLPLGEEVPDATGEQRRKVCIEEAYPEQYMSRCLPRVLLFSRIVPHPYNSTLLPLDRLSALRNLLAHSGHSCLTRARWSSTWRS